MLHVLIYFPEGSKMKNKGEKNPHNKGSYHQNWSDTNTSAFLYERAKVEPDKFLIYKVLLLSRAYKNHKRGEICKKN